MKLNDEIIHVLPNGDTYYYIGDEMKSNIKEEKLPNGGIRCTFPNGDIYYYYNERLHREGGPAVIYPTGYKEWYINGKLHREDGPAVIWANGKKEWWLHGEQITKGCFMTNIELAQRMKAWELFDPKELLEIKNGK